MRRQIFPFESADDLLNPDDVENKIKELIEQSPNYKKDTITDFLCRRGVYQSLLG